MPGEKQIRTGAFEGLQLVGEEIENQAAVQFRVVHPAAFQLTILVVLDEVVIGVAREGQRIEPERVYDRQTQHRQVWLGRFQDRTIMLDQVVPEEQLRSST